MDGTSNIGAERGPRGPALFAFRAPLPQWLPGAPRISLAVQRLDLAGPRGSSAILPPPAGPVPAGRASPRPPYVEESWRTGKTPPAAPRVWQYISLPRGAEATGGAYLENRILRGERPCLRHGRSPGDRT